MPAIEIRDKENKVLGSMEVSDKFAIRGKDALVHEAVVNYLANQRQGTHATKTWGMVSGGGKKPWKQKHTGRARTGSIRNPLWRGGAIIFGPQPRDYSYSINRTAKRKALYAALSARLEDGEMTVIDSLKLEKPGTKEMLNILKGLGLDGQSTLIVTAELDRNVYLSARNLPRVSVVRAADLNTYDVVVHNRILATREALEALEAREI